MRAALDTGRAVPARPTLGVMPSSSRLMLLDAASLYFRAFHGVPEQGRARSGLPTNAVRGFLDMIATLVTEHRPTHLVACWDNDWRPAFRVELIPSYKAHRVAETASGSHRAGPADQTSPASGGPAEEVPADLAPQIPLIVDALAAVGLARVGIDGYEADDVIGSYTTQWTRRMPIDIVTGDRDLFQLIDDAAGIRVLYTARGGVRQATVVTAAHLAQTYGVQGGDGYLDMSILRGDASDGLPGVKGIGEKTASQLVTEFGSLPALRAALDRGDPRLRGARRANLEAAGSYLDAATRVVAVARDLALPDLDPALPAQVADPGRLKDLADAHSLTNPVNRLLTALDLEP